MEQYFLGIDCGLTSIKVIVFNRFGQIVRKESKKNEVINGIIDTQLLWNKISLCIKNVIEGISRQIIGVSVCGHGNGLYLIVNGKPYKYAYSSMYSGANVVDDRISDITLQTVWAGQPLNILTKIKREDYKFYNSIDKILFCKDYIRYMLTGKIATDYSDASAAGILDNNSYSVSSNLYSLFGLDGVEKLIPEVYYSYDLAGYINEETEKQTGLIKGTPVAIGAFDVCGCIIGSGIKDESDYSIIAGTWGINSALCKNKIKDSRITQCCSFIDRNYNVCIESAPTSCVNLEWFLKNVCPYVSYQEILDIVEHETDVIYLPYIYPTMRKPLQRADFVNLRIEHTYKDMIKAILEGVVFEHRLQIEALKSVGLERKEVVISGGATNNNGWCQLFADVLNIPVKTTVEKECGAVGAAIFASIVSGGYKNVEAAQNEMVKYDKIFVPQKNYDEKYKKFLEVLRRNDGFRA